MKLTLKGEEIFIDEEDLPLFLGHKWYIAYAKKNKYIVRTEYKTGKAVRKFFHREVFSIPDTLTIDHIDRNGLNNQKKNLRAVLIGTNNHNCRTRGNTKYKGVHKNGNCYIAQIQYQYTKIYLGCHETAEIAAHHYDLAAVILYGEEASINFEKNKKEYLRQKKEMEDKNVSIW